MKDIEEIKNYLTAEERVLLKKYQRMSDEALLDVLRQKAEELGRLPTKSDVACFVYFKYRFGPWPRILEKAGLKPVSEGNLRRKERNKRRQMEMRKRTMDERRRRREEREAGGVIIEKENSTTVSDDSSYPADYSCGGGQRA